MRKYIALAAGIALGICFLMASVPVLFNIPMKMPPLRENSPPWHFMQAFGPTGYVKFVATFQFVGALFVMLPRLRNIGLLLLGPVIVNIVAFHVLVDDDPQHLLALLNPLRAVIIVSSLYLLWDARHKFSGLLN